eukprot:m.134166 g.134166  ORF g.134166 m.134166 type:complete len:101 (-) comp14689_c0_seq6:3196-3498(-)
MFYKLSIKLMVSGNNSTQLWRYRLHNAYQNGTNLCLCDSLSPLEQEASQHTATNCIQECCVLHTCFLQEMPKQLVLTHLANEWKLLFPKLILEGLWEPLP